jgi:hypothetical protein
MDTMRKTHWTVIAVALTALLGAATGEAGTGNTLAVTSPGLDGSNFKLTATSTGADNNQVWVQDDSPACESTYNWEVQTATPGLLLDADDKVVATLVRQEAPADNMIRCTLRQAPNGNNNEINCLMRRDGGGWRFAGKGGYGLAATPTWRMEIIKDSGAGDGTVRFYKITSGGSELQHERFDYDNSTLCFDRFRIGFTQPLAASTRPVGDFDFDNVVETR